MRCAVAVRQQAPEASSGVVGSVDAVCGSRQAASPRGELGGGGGAMMRVCGSRQAASPRGELGGDGER